MTTPQTPLTDRDEILKLVAGHGRWWHTLREHSVRHPSVPYFLDEEGSVHNVTGRSTETSTTDESRPWWKFWA